MDLLNICLTSTYFQYNGKHYKQLHGTAMGSRVSDVVEEIVMQHVEERALATCRQTIPLWLRYVHDTFTTIHKERKVDRDKQIVLPALLFALSSIKFNKKSIILSLMYRSPQSVVKSSTKISMSLRLAIKPPFVGER